MWVPQEADDLKRDVEHLEKTALSLKSKNKKLEFDLQRMSKGMSTGRSVRLGEGQVDPMKMYDDKIKGLEADNKLLEKSASDMKAKSAAEKRRLESLQKKYEELMKNGGGGGGGFQGAAPPQQL